MSSRPSLDEVILTLNAGSSSLKFAIFAHGTPLPPQPDIVGQIDGLGAQPHLRAKDSTGAVLVDTTLDLPGQGAHQAALTFILRWLQEHMQGIRIVAAGHRVVHGGPDYAQPIQINDSIFAKLHALIPLAPLHQPHNLAGIAATRDLLPDLPQIACFDTAFHRSQPEVAQWYGLPRALLAQGIRRYGYHGLSYEYIADVLPKYLGTDAEGRIIVAHLGNGASLCALRERKSMATTMGFSTIDGLLMGTRCGALDPGILLYLLDYQGMNSKELTRILYKESGLLGVSGISQDMRVLLQSPQKEAADAVALFCHRLVCEIGALTAAIGGLDALIFTGGIGENAASLREKVMISLDWLGFTLDPHANAAGARRITSPKSRNHAWVLPTNEEWMIARHTAQILGAEKAA